MSKKLILLAAACCFSLNVYAQEPINEAQETVEAVQEHVAEAAAEAPVEGAHTTEMATEEVAMETEHGAAAAHAGESHDGGMYAVVKYFTSPGASYTHGTNIITGKTASGFGVDVGMNLGGHMAVELNLTSGSGKFTEVAASANGISSPTLRANSTATTDSTTTTDTTTTSHDTASSEHAAGDGVTYSSIGVVGVYGFPVFEKCTVIGKLGLISETEKLDVIGSSSSTGAVYALGFEHSLGNHKEIVVEYEDTTITGPRAYTLFVGYKFGF